MDKYTADTSPHDFIHGMKKYLDNTFGKGFSWKDAPWFDANGLKDVAKIQKNTVLENLQ